MRRAAIRAETLFVAFLMGACVVLALISLRQRSTIRALGEQVRVLTEQLGTAALPVGEIVAPLGAFVGGGAPNTAPLDWDHERRLTVVLVRTRDCGACAQVATPFEQLARSGAGAGVVFVELFTDASTPGEIPMMEAGSSAIRCGVPGNEGTWLRRIPLVPSILAIDSRGAVAGAWYGVPLAAHWDQIARVVKGE